LQSEDNGWLRDAQCVGAPHELFFPVIQGVHRWDEGKEICASCSVTKECLAIAMPLEDTEDRWGIFGGLNPAERSELRRKKK
jgi:hypothetical protein